MRTRTILLVVSILLLAGFVALNIDEFSRVSMLSLGVTTVQVPLGLVMLLLLVIATVVFLASTLYMQSKNLLENNKQVNNTSNKSRDMIFVKKISDNRQPLKKIARAEH